MERVLGLVRQCRVVLGSLEHPLKPDESSSAEAERILYFALMSAIEAGLIRTMEDALKVLRPRESAIRAGWARRVVGAPSRAMRMGNE